MNIDEAKAAVGQLVMSRDAGSKMIESVPEPHGPYKLLRVTKGGRCELEREKGDHGPRTVKPSLLSLPLVSDL